MFLQIDDEGNIVWNKTIGDENATDYATSVNQVSDGGFILTELSTKSGRGSIPLIRTDQQGDILWSQDLLAGRGVGAGMAVLKAPDGGFLIAGMTGETVGDDEAVLVSTDREGCVQETVFSTPSPGSSDHAIAFVPDRDGNGEIYVMAADGSNQRRLTSDPLWDGIPTWSPDGSQISFCSRRDAGDFDVYVMDSTGTTLRRLTDGPAEDFSAGR